MMLTKLNELVKEKRQEQWPDYLIINHLKEYLQLPVLDFIYKNNKYQNYIFIGGSALRIIHGLPRMSEDIDFNLNKVDFKNIDLDLMGKEIQKYFLSNFDLSINYKFQKNLRLYLKFPILKKINLSQENEIESLYVKIEPSLEDFIDPEYEINPLSQSSYNMLIKTYSLKFLMTGKIGAIIERKWFKGKDNEIKIKGRDYYDLYWYLSKNIEPDYSHLNLNFGIKNRKQLNSILKKKIEDEVSAKQLFYDLKYFFSDQKFINDFCKNYQSIMNKYLST